MDEGLQFVTQANEWTWNHFRDDLKDMTPEEADWRPLPAANSINLILRHLRLEAQWHVASLERGDPMPTEVTASDQRLMDSAPADFDRNLEELEALYARFLTALRGTTLPGLQEQSALAYTKFQALGVSCPSYFSGFHQLVHLATHWGQIRTIRNLYRKARAEPALFFPENPTYPKVES